MYLKNFFIFITNLNKSPFELWSIRLAVLPIGIQIAWIAWSWSRMCWIQCIIDDIHSWRLTHNFGELIWSSHSWYVCMRTGTVLYTTNNYTKFIFCKKRKRIDKTHRYDRILKARIFFGWYVFRNYFENHRLHFVNWTVPNVVTMNL